MSEQSHYDNYWRGVSGWKPADSLDADLAAWMQPLMQPDWKVLDVGCGDGSRCAAPLIARGVELHGIDVSSVAATAAAARGIKAKCGSLSEKLPYEDGQFDAALCLEVFQHLVNPEFAAGEIFRVLRAGALFLASVPNVANWRSRFDMLFFGRCRTGGSPLNVRFPWRDPHLRLFNAKAIRDMLASAGFQIQRTGGLHTNFLSQAPLARRLAGFRPVSAASQAIGRVFPSLLAGRCVVLARKPNA
jgi:methionine biosynthesis protein MetW